MIIFVGYSVNGSGFGETVFTKSGPNAPRSKYLLILSNVKF